MKNIIKAVNKLLVELRLVEIVTIFEFKKVFMMTLPADQKVREFLEKIKMIDYPKYEIVEEALKKVLECYPESSQRMMYGGILFSLEDDFGGVFVYKNHVSFEFSNGCKFKDPEHLLEGKGKFRRHLKIKTSDDHKLNKLDFFLKQI